MLYNTKQVTKYKGVIMTYKGRLIRKDGCIKAYKPWDTVKKEVTNE